METIGIFAKRMDVTVRTLRYYDDIGLLQPKLTNAQGHKVYGEEEEQHFLRIQAWKFLGVPLEEIKLTLDDKDENYSSILSLQKELLMEQKERIETMIEAVEDAEQIVKVSQGNAAEYKDIFFMIVNMYRLEKEQKKFLIEYFPKASVEALFQPNSKREDYLKDNIEFFHQIVSAMRQGKDPTNDDVQSIIKKMTDDLERTIEPSILQDISSKMDIFGDNAHLLESVIPTPIRTYADKAFDFHYAQRIPSDKEKTK